MEGIEPPTQGFSVLTTKTSIPPGIADATYIYVYKWKQVKVHFYTNLCEFVHFESHLTFELIKVSRVHIFMRTFSNWNEVNFIMCVKPKIELDSKEW